MSPHLPRRLHPLLVMLAIALGALTALGQRQPSIESRVSTDRAEVGERFQVELEAMSSDEPAPSNPRLDAPPGMTVQGPSVSSRHQVSIVNGEFSHQRGLTATWTVTGTKPGKYILGPAHVQVGGRTISGQTFEVEIVPRGTLKRKPSRKQAPHRRRRPFDDPFDFDPFDLMPKLPQLPGRGDDANRRFRSSTEHPPELEVEHAPDSLAFLKAVALPTNAVVGQQISLKIFAYGSRGPFKEVYTSEPNRADFLSHPIIENSYNEPRYRMYIDDELWHAVQVREIALFPLKAGTLAIGPMRMGFSGSRYPQDAPHKGLVRYSDPLKVVVREPPVQGRPPGYQVGDVGRFSLSAEVSPREIDAGDAVSVRIELEGRGYPPSRLRLPEVPSVRFSDPKIDESFEPKGSVVHGSRIFSYIVHIDRAGRIDLGEVTLPHYDARRRRYRVARASLGTVVVLSNGSREDGDSGDEAKRIVQQLGARVEARPELGPAPTGRLRWTDHPAYWALLVAGPATVVTAAGATRAGKRLAARWANKRRSHSAVAREALRQARTAASREDAGSAAASIERAVYASIEEQTGLKGRGLLRSRLAHELQDRGVDRELATELVNLLGELDDLRFASSSAASLDAIVSRAERAVARLSQVKRRSKDR